ncbi:type II CRISPR-associated endonuclease Cas1 [Maribacter polysiphoniae]|uniref:CRISPR-associated endonuclease Cas1 n=1 Tax=Maribacter polysiphoniae TaxID=429344 RepID=A0A316DKS2_9FLAO|nr:type II CRISPR-associated endonuclease Cas1 [Maribacter polysiphoniae]MBD1263063.1 type II CRISPR-associated endonuclease Cas1 [Maribacter polysiphoniae]PWK18847.1 CRISPR-associated protein Cas1 [Maribacter polysiphoniae]|tara:strand:+ start:3762 stop:4658 length:897 start_codon:yes stop_codon:yes gene_type:complete
MIKRTLFFGNPAYLSTRNEQLVVNFPEEGRQEATIPIEDLGYVVLEDPQITVTNGLLRKLVQNKTAVITCDLQHLPCSLLQPLVGHTEQTERMRYQLNASVPLKKNLWQQTVSIKIENQASHLLQRNKNALKLKRWAKEVKSGDAQNHEAIAAAYYFQNLFDIEGFSRNQKGIAPNNLLNYGYAILRAVTARALVSSGLLPSVGIYHRNKYNAFCLADDIMEPYRPYVDTMVLDIVLSGEPYDELNKELKSELLGIPAMDVMIDGKQSPLMNAMSRTTNSLYECFLGSSRRLLYPEFL